MGLNELVVGALGVGIGCTLSFAKSYFGSFASELGKSHATAVDADIGKLLESGKPFTLRLSDLKADVSSLPSKSDFAWHNLLFGDTPASCSIIAGDSNILRLANKQYGPSLYIRRAFSTAEAYLKNNVGDGPTIPLSFSHPIMKASQHESHLILGGPIANITTRSICGYEMKHCERTPDKQVPVFQGLLPFGFYCGNENGLGYWGDKEIKVLRWNEDGSEESLLRYGILKRGSNNPIEPPIENGRLAGDMLMVIRLPNSSSGYFTIIGGMHGYSLKAFFDDIEGNMTKLSEMVGNAKYFQALIPAEVVAGGQATMNWKGWPNWRPEFAVLNEHDFIKK